MPCLPLALCSLRRFFASIPGSGTHMACVRGDLRGKRGGESVYPNSALQKSCSRLVGRPTSTTLLPSLRAGDGDGSGVWKGCGAWVFGLDPVHCVPVFRVRVDLRMVCLCASCVSCWSCISSVCRVKNCGSVGCARASTSAVSAWSVCASPPPPPYPLPHPPFSRRCGRCRPDCQRPWQPSAPRRSVRGHVSASQQSLVRRHFTRTHSHTQHA